MITVGGMLLENSHRCLTEAKEKCFNPKHFSFTSRLDNTRRMAHQNGNARCDCAEQGALPCLTNGKYEPIVEDDEIVGWREQNTTQKRKEPIIKAPRAKRMKMM